MDKSRISIIVPVYNAEEYLARCLDSILSQELTSYEVILVDDGSTDASPLICDRYSATDSRFRTLHRSNGGVSSARNAGLNMAKGEYIMFVDADDVLLPYALEHMMENMRGEDLILGGYAVFVGGVPHKEVKPKRTFSYPTEMMSLFFDENIRRNCEMLDAPWAKMFKRKAIGNLRFSEELSYAEDKLFVFSFMTQCSSVHACAEAVYGYYIRPGSLGSDIVSDRHLSQLRTFLPAYASKLEILSKRFPSCAKVTNLYHKDLISRYVCRIMNIFMTRRSALLDKEYIAWIYDLMRRDSRLGVFSVRAGQVFNLILYRIGSPKFTVGVYKFTSRICSIFRRS